MDIRLKKRSECDSAFLFHLFSQIKKAELHFDLYPEDISSQIFQMQFNAWEQMVHTNYPGCGDFLITCDSEKAGRLQVDRDSEEFRIINISLLPSFRNRGVGTKIIRDILAEARQKGKPVYLEVDKNNPAVKLYLRLGFKVCQENELKFSMKYQQNQDVCF